MPTLINKTPKTKPRTWISAVMCPLSTSGGRVNSYETRAEQGQQTPTAARHRKVGTAVARYVKCPISAP